MKKAIAMILILSCCLCACNTSTNGNKVENEVFQEESHKTEKNSSVSKNQQMEGMKILCDSESLTSCYTDDGYYYLTEDTIELKDGTYGMHLMYMDFATQQEIYLCSNTGCEHNTADCSSVFPMDEFPWMSSCIFVYKDKLFVLSKEMDDEGVVSQDFSIGIGDEVVETEASQAVLYQMNLDGTNLHKVYTFEAGLTVEDIVLGNHEGLYFVTKKLSTVLGDGNSNVTTSSDKNLVFLDVKTEKAREVCSLNFDDGIMWDVFGVFQDMLVLKGVDYGKELTTEDYTLNDDDWIKMYKKSSDVVAILDLNTKKLSEMYRIDNSVEHSAAVKENMLYVSFTDSNEVKVINLETGEEHILCSLTQNYILDTFDDVLCCQSLDCTSDATYYFVNTKTGEIKNSPLVNQSLGWSLEFKAEVGSQILLIYDYEADALGDGAYEITQYKYALIEKEDLYAGNANYKPIKMIGRGC